jgi:Tol biopolymer transport system component
MKKHTLGITAFFLICVSGCSTLATKQPDFFIVTPVQVNPTNTIEQTTSSPLNKLQITYTESKNNSTEFFAVDITCIEENNLCFGEPVLLFKTLSASSDDPNRPMGSIRGYSWSPDGDKIVLSASKDIFIGDMNTQEWENITNSPNVEEYDPKWSQDKRYIYFLACTQDDTGMGSCKLARLDLVDNTNMFLLDTIKDSIATFAFSLDGQSVVFSVSEGFDRLYKSNIDGSNIHQITVTDSEETSPSFSYDGKSIVFVRTNRPTLVANSKEIFDVVVMNSEGGEEKNLTEEFANQAFSPAFSFDGKWVAFSASDEDLNDSIYVVSIDKLVVIQVTQGNGDKVYPSWRSFYGQ